MDLQGGRLAALQIDGLDILVPADERPTRWGSFPMIPWCGRLDHGRFEFEGAAYDFPLTSPPHANHGRTHLQAWHQVSDTEIRTDLVDPWPFGGYAIQRFSMTDTSLMVTAEVHNETRSMPAMAGWHPWFRRQLDRGEPAKLSFDADAIYETDAFDIPKGSLVAIPPAPWNACFTGVRNGPSITWPGAIHIELTSTFSDWVIFTEPDHALCVEPQSGPPNQVNSAPLIVAPGRSLVGSMIITWV